MTKEPCISIVGLGLMGASLAMALRKRGYAGRLVAYARKYFAAKDKMLGTA